MKVTTVINNKAEGVGNEFDGILSDEGASGAVGNGFTGIITSGEMTGP